MMKSIPKNIIPFLILNVVIGAGVVFAVAKDSTSSLTKAIRRDTSKEFVFTSPILDCENIEKMDSHAVSYKEITTKSQALANQYGLSDYSVYFRDLNNGLWVGINEKALFSPASLMKTPVLIAFLKNVERNPELLQKEVVATEEYFTYAIQQNFELKTKIEKGKTYTLEQVLTLMITESDNVATLMLSKYITEKDYNDLLAAVGLVAEENGKDVDVRVKDFAGFFRILYNASYLHREYSEYALSVLSRSTFTSAMVAGVPKGIAVAHKYGERSLEQKKGGLIVTKEKQLHDCGIVYLKSSPYILCVMTRGSDFENQEQFISAISKYVYTQVAR